MIEAATRAEPAADPVGPGRLVLVVGPSGAGKDTILRAAKAACVADNTIVFVHRVITRPPNRDEDHDSVDAAHFAAMLRDGACALHWEAHGLQYGIPRTIDDDIRRGRTVVVNASRGIVAAARARYAHVTAVMVTAAADVLASRLAARGRASDTSLAGRLDRNSLYTGFSTDAVIRNDGSAEDAAKLFVEFLRSCSAT